MLWLQTASELCDGKHQKSCLTQVGCSKGQAHSEGFIFWNRLFLVHCDPEFTQRFHLLFETEVKCIAILDLDELLLQLTDA